MNTITQSRTAIEDLLQQRIEALYAKDAHAAIAHYAPQVALFDVAPPLRQSDGDAHDPVALQDWLDGWDGPVEHELRDLEIASDEHLAFAHAFVHMRGTKHSGERVNLWLRMTVGCRRLEGRWKIVHEHNSVPFYMDGSYRAAVDLQPETP